MGLRVSGLAPELSRLRAHYFHLRMKLNLMRGGVQVGKGGVAVIPPNVMLWLFPVGRCPLQTKKS